MKNAAGRSTEVRLALKLMSRELRSGELTLIFLALVLAVTVTTAIALFSQRLDLAMQASANDMLGADLRVRSTTPLEDEWLAEADSLGLDRARALTFPSVVVAGDQWRFERQWTGRCARSAFAPHGLGLQRLRSGSGWKWCRRRK